MKVRRGKIIGSVIVMAIGSFLAVSSAHGQVKPAAPATGAAAAAKPLMAEQAFKDVQILKGIPVDQFMDTMGFFAASLGLNCTDCHGRDSAGSWAKYADDNKLKTTARKMILMARSINEANFGGAPTITCYTCHRNDKDPKPRPSLAEQYSTNPPLGDPNDFVVPQQDPTMPPADQVFSKFVDAIGGAQHLAALTSYTAKGTYVGWDTEQELAPVDIYAKSNERTTIVHTANGDSTRVFDGSGAWIAAPDKPLPLIALSGGDLFGAKIDALAYLPTDIKKIATQWRVGVLNIDGEDVQVVQGNNPGQLPVKLFFDPKTGLLTREVRVTTTSVGQVPTQIDFSDYRDIGNGVKLPYKSVVSWTDGQATIVLESIQPNAAIDPVKFVKPAPSKDWH